MSDLYDVIIHDENDAYIRFPVKATAMGNAINKGREKAKKRKNQIPKDVDRDGLMITVRRESIFDGQTVPAFPRSRSTRAQIGATGSNEAD